MYRFAVSVLSPLNQVAHTKEARSMRTIENKYQSTTPNVETCRPASAVLDEGHVEVEAIDLVGAPRDLRVRRRYEYFLQD